MNNELIIFYISGVVAILSTVMVITRFNMIHALLYLIVSFLAMAVIFYIMGAPFAAALEVIIYAGAIVVLIIFVIMMISLKDESVEQEKRWLTPKVWIGPGILSLILLTEVMVVLLSAQNGQVSQQVVDSKAVGRSLYGPYIIGVELSGFLLMAGIVGAYHLGRQRKKIVHRFLQTADE
jgi:NADH-quinone oxidoreductase subunit J